MSDHSIPHFQNDAGSAQIKIGVKSFMCCGASAPFDHPHIYLDMGTENEIVCPYCSTLFKHSNKLKPNESEPQNCLYDDAHS
ncbi:MAG: zinc-finger domain-containing protein [Rhizobiaceae bacterium]|nr:zinc-finger domain-containing protein [Rhizobiaceae bacterium]